MAIFKRGRKWVSVTYAGRVNGKIRQVWKTFGTRSEAEMFAARQTLDGVATAPARMTVSEYLRDWLDVLTIRPQSEARYRSAVENHLAPALGHVRLGKLVPAMIEDFIKRQINAGYSPRTIRVNLNVLATALNRAAKHRLIPINPMQFANLPSPGQSSAKHWDTEQVRLFLGAVKRSPLRALFITTVATGLRSCEVRALREEDYDPPFLHVRQKVRRVRGGWVFEDTQKTEKSRRTVMLPAFARTEVGRQITGQGGLLFRSQSGGPLFPTNVQEELDRIAKDARIPRIRFHDLRHTQATVLAHAGVAPQIIQHRLGHSKIGITMDLYAHEMPGQDAPAVEALERMLGDEISRD